MGLNGHDISNFEPIPLLSQSSRIRKKDTRLLLNRQIFLVFFFYLKRDSDQRPSTP